MIVDHGPHLQLFGALEGIRTPNLLIRSQVLYPLSYERWPPADQPPDNG
jgi:hypothetical protein